MEVEAVLQGARLALDVFLGVALEGVEEDLAPGSSTPRELAMAPIMASRRSRRSLT